MGKNIPFCICILLITSEIECISINVLVIYNSFVIFPFLWFQLRESWQVKSQVAWHDTPATPSCLSASKVPPSTEEKRHQWKPVWFTTPRIMVTERNSFSFWDFFPTQQSPALCMEWAVGSWWLFFPQPLPILSSPFRSPGLCLKLDHFFCIISGESLISWELIMYYKYCAKNSLI